jgi:hypothetical protein
MTILQEMLYLFATGEDDDELVNLFRAADPITRGEFMAAIETPVTTEPIIVHEVTVLH